MLRMLLREGSLVVRSVLARLLLQLALSWIAPSYNIHRQPPSGSKRRLPRLAWSRVTVDKPLAIVEPAPKVPNYRELLRRYREEHGKPLKPIARRPGCLPVPEDIRCPYCKAPARFIYQNNGGRGQFLCKVCHHTFHRGTRPNRIRYRCPYCFHALERVKQRGAFDVYKCTHKACPYRRRQLRRLNAHQRRLLRERPHEFKLCYIFRKPKIHWQPGKIQNPRPATVDLARIHNPLEIVALCLYFFTEHALSLRQIQRTLHDLYGVELCHQTVLNYVEAAALRLLPLAFQQGLSIAHDWAVDETYIRITTKWGYVFFAFSPSQGRIGACVVSLKRDTRAACELLAQLAHKASWTEDDPPLLATDGNPIYKLAVNFAAHFGFAFRHSVATGLLPSPDESPEARLLRQFVERLHRTFKEKYRHTTGFKSLNGAFVFAVLFVLWFNYFHQPDKEVPERSDCPFTRARWILLLKDAETVPG